MLSLSAFKEKTAASGAVRWPEAPPLETLWRFPVTASREDIWKYLSDTSRFNREIGLSKRTEREIDGEVHVTTTMMGIPQRWIEEPWNWIAGQTIASKRTYQQGLAKKVHAVFDIDEESAGARFVYIYFGWTPKNAFWSLFLKLTASMLQKKFSEAFLKIDRHFSVGSERRMFNALQKKAPEMTERGAKLLQEQRAQLAVKVSAPVVVNSLCDWILNADDLDIENIKVRALAQQWKVDHRELLKVCLHAAHSGLLQISWKVVCPHCRGPRFSAESLGDIPEEANCETCELDFKTGAQEAVEVMFHVHPSIRVVTPALYCAAEPAKKPHIKVQQRIAPGETLRVRQSFASGNHRVRAIGQTWEVLIHADKARPAATIDCGRGAESKNGSAIFEAGLENELRFRNDTKEDVLFISENLWWESEILKPVDVFSSPEFRHLFSQEHLDVNVQLHLGEQALLFTDIVGSTMFYNDVGDAKAFVEIRGHFQEIFKVVGIHHGVVVKTIGDAVMASFPSIEDALTAAVAIQDCFPAKRTSSPIRVRVSVHKGQVMAVHLNSGVDYFGSAVNFTAKIQSAANAHEIAMSQEVYARFAEEFAAKSQNFSVRRHEERRRYLNAAEIFVVKVGGAAAGKAAS